MTFHGGKCNLGSVSVSLKVIKLFLSESVAIKFYVSFHAYIDVSFRFAFERFMGLKGRRRKKATSPHLEWKR